MVETHAFVSILVLIVVNFIVLTDQYNFNPMTKFPDATSGFFLLGGEGEFEAFGLFAFVDTRCT